MKRHHGLSLPRAGAMAILGEVQEAGADMLESGGFLLAPIGSRRVGCIALAGRSGIEREQFFFQISAPAIDKLFAFASENELWIPGQFHSHYEHAFLSRTDSEHAFRCEGFASIVVPLFTQPPEDAHAWGWWIFEHGEWAMSKPANVVTGTTRVVYFDEEGIRDA